MQAQHVSLSEFYVLWLRTVMEVKMVTNQLAQALVPALTARLQPLMTNPAFKAALLIDPRFNYLNSKVMSAEDKEDTKVYTVKSPTAQCDIHPPQFLDCLASNGADYMYVVSMIYRKSGVA